MSWLEALTKELVIPEGSGYSLASDSERTLCATLTSSDRPVPDNRSWYVDNDFVGITPLCDPDEPDVDVVAVTGLGGHAMGSYRSTDGTCIWLRDFAPVDVPNARFLTYGYKTAVGDSDSKQGIQELARIFLDTLVKFRRRTQTSNRPLYFVGHSLGGIVTKAALVISSKATDREHRHLHDVILATGGLILLGVPNLGLRHTQFMTVVQGQPNDRLVRDLLTGADGEPSQYLNHLTEDFALLCRRQQSSWSIISYHETMHSAIITAGLYVHHLYIPDTNDE